MRLLQRDMQGDLVVEFQRDDLAGAGGGFKFGEAAIDGDAVLEMDDEVALHQLGEVEQLVDLRRGRGRSAMERCAPLPLASEDFGFRYQDKAARVRGQSQAGRPGGLEFGGTVGDAEAFIDCAPQETRMQFLQRRICGEDLPGARLFAVLGHGHRDRVAFLLPADHLLEEVMAGLFLDLQSFVGDQRIGGIPAVMGEAFRVPGLLVADVLEESGSFIEVAHGDRGGAAGENWFEG